MYYYKDSSAVYSFTKVPGTVQQMEQVTEEEYTQIIRQARQNRPEAEPADAPPTYDELVQALLELGVEL